MGLGKTGEGKITHIIATVDTSKFPLGGEDGKSAYWGIGLVNMQAVVQGEDAPRPFGVRDGQPGTRTERYYYGSRKFIKARDTVNKLLKTEDVDPESLEGMTLKFERVENGQFFDLYPVEIVSAQAATPQASVEPLDEAAVVAAIVGHTPAEVVAMRAHPGIKGTEWENKLAVKRRTLDALPVTIGADGKYQAK